MGLYDYKCPSCKEELSFDESCGKFKCIKCLNEYDIEASEFFKKADGEISWNTSFEEKVTSQKRFNKEEEEKFTVYKCPSCGEEFISHFKKIASKCIYCGNDILLKGNISEAVRPDVIIPFGVKKEKAAEAIKRFCAKKKLVPKGFSEKNFYEDIKAFYLPVWLFKGEGRTEAFFKTSKMSWDKEGKKDLMKRDFYGAERSGEIIFDDILLSASKNMGDDFIKGLGEYFFTEEKTFAPESIKEYLWGKFSLDKGKAVKEKIKSNILSEYNSTLKEYPGIELKGMHTDFEKCELKYALLPVWLMNVRYEGEVYSFAMNGQTGKFAGKIPVGKGEHLKYFLLCFAVIAAIGVVIASII